MDKMLHHLRRVSILFFVVLLSSCVTEREAVYKPPPEKVVSPPEAKASAAPKEAITCEEETAKSINRSGIETLPFMRINFFDIDGAGLQDMVIGNKNGSLYLYKNTGDPLVRSWKRIPEYFDGVKAGAFSSPALADFDGDGKAELIVGTGGFSSDSGKILFFRNEGSIKNPAWKRIADLSLSIGNDAAVTVVDYDFDGRPDIIACNSEGKLFFFRNVSKGGTIRFVKDDSPPVKANFGMYAVPAAKKIGDKVVLIIGNSMGKLFMFEIKKNGNGLRALQYKLGASTKTFASPAFASLLDKGRSDLVVADGDGMISYYESKSGDFTSLRKNEDLFNNRILAGPVCSPTISCIGDKTYMVIGNMDGALRLFQYNSSKEGIPWIENQGYFSGIKVQGFSRGVLTTWEGTNMLITGQGNGNIRAFINTGKSKPAWKERARFFQGVSIREHSTPVIFDLEGDGKWELISGAADGKIYAFRIKEMKKGEPVWERIEGVFDDIQVSGFSVPAIVKDDKAIHLFVGQQDGRIRTFKAEISGKLNYRALKFRETGFLSDIRMNEHSSPFVQLNNGVFDIISGDYNGNLRHFLCRSSWM